MGGQLDATDAPGVFHLFCDRRIFMGHTCGPTVGQRDRARSWVHDLDADDAVFQKDVAKIPQEMRRFEDYGGKTLWIIT